MMYWFLQGKMCSERDIFFIIHQLRSLLLKAWPSPLENSYSLQQLWVDWAIDACVQTVMDSLLCKLPHPINATSVHQQRATISSPFLQAEDTLTVVTRIVKYFGFSRQLWVACCAIWHKTCLFACIVLDVIWKKSKRSNKKVWDVIWKSSKRSSKSVLDVIWKSSNRSSKKVLDVIWKNSKLSNKKVWYVIWKSSKRSNKKVWYVIWKNSKRSNKKVWDVIWKSSKRSGKSFLDVVWKSSKRSSKKVWDVMKEFHSVATRKS